MSMRTTNHEHERLISMVNQLMDERDVLYRENEYLKSKLNESILVETIHEMKRERFLLLKLLSNLTVNNNQGEQLRYIIPHIKENNSDMPSSSAHSKSNVKPVHYENPSVQKNATILRNNPCVKINSNRTNKLKINAEEKQQPTIYRRENTKDNSIHNSDRSSSSSSSIIQSKNVQLNKKFVLFKKPVISLQSREFNKPMRKYNFSLKHSHNSPFQRYRSQSLQDLT